MPVLVDTQTILLAVVPGPGLLFGLMLAAGIVGAYSARFIRLPRVVGFVVAGVALRGALGAMLGVDLDETTRAALEAAARPLKAIKDLALGLILFSIGGVFERSALRAGGARLLRMSVVETSLVAGLVFALCGGALLLTDASTSISQQIVLAVLLALAAIATAPAATLFVLQEYEAKGPATRTILGLTALNNVVCIVAFQTGFLALAALGFIATQGSVSEHIGSALLASTVGSVALGGVAGVALSVMHARLPLRETMLFFFAVFIVLGAGEAWLWQHHGVSYNFLLTALVIGGVFANVAIDAQKLNTSLRTIGSPIFAGFFVMAGYDLHLADLPALGWLGGAYILARTFAKRWGCVLGGRWSGTSDVNTARIGGALLCQAAVVIGLASFVERYWASDLASRFTTVILGSVVVFELIGPLLVKRCVVQAGEVKAVSLLTRGRNGENTSMVRLTLRSFGRLFRRSGGEDAEPATLQVHDIMRTNVQFIPASATFDEVLHTIERSTHAHFPVVRDDRMLVGVIHFSDVRDVIYDPGLSDLVTATDLADAQSAPVPMDMPLSDLLDEFTRQNVAVLPVVESADGKRVVGLVEQRDLLQALHGGG